ncbi:hypothetical protein [Tenacibaculum litopenaei]|uniref:hypothetical protein n=1 Tax=Tenacibaculum litopenaei TaxID=396016 RepID=UPI0038B48D2E
MFRYIFILMLMTLTKTNCTGHKKVLKNGKAIKLITGNFIISKIDSTNSYYLIYGLKNKNSYKIISKKELSAETEEKLEIGKNYLLSLKNFRQQDDNPLTGYSSSDPCFFLDKNTQICTEENVFGPYITEDLVGLYYVKK